MPMNYYNEHDPGAADWLESLIERDLIPAGTVDRRSIEDVLPDELLGYTQCHFFAGIGGWSRALELAGHATTQGIWTGSCPCQPFSSAGKGAGTADERHLWPAFHWLISQCRPELVFGEQVAGKAGESWFDIVQHDLAAEGYTSGMSVLAACSVGAPHIRKRLYWVANAEHVGWWEGEFWAPEVGSTKGHEDAGKLPAGPEGLCTTIGLANANQQRRREEGNSSTTQERVSRGLSSGGMANAEHDDGRADKQEREAQRGAVDGWANPEWIECRDGKARPFKPGVLPLASRIPGRVELIKGYGNAIVPQCGDAFIRAFYAAQH